MERRRREEILVFSDRRIGSPVSAILPGETNAHIPLIPHSMEGAAQTVSDHRLVIDKEQSLGHQLPFGGAAG